MTVTLLALGAALLYGTADFCGGTAARRATTFSVLLTSLCSGLAALLLTSIWFAGPSNSDALTWGFAAGIVGSGGLFLFYGALARGPMSVVAPVSALVAAVLPVGAGLVRGERLGGWVFLGVALCVIAIVLVSVEPAEPSAEVAAVREGEGLRDQDRHRGWRRIGGGPVLAVVAGAFFGVFFIMLREAGQGGTVWPLVMSKAAGVIVAVVGALLIRARARAGSAFRDPATALIALGAGVFDAGANALYLLATQVGLLSLAAVLTALYPAITVLLAGVVFRERLRFVQRVGLTVAAAGVALVTVG